MAEDPEMASFVKTTFGITGLSTLNNIKHFNIIECFPQDIMHVIYEGLLPMEVKLLTQYVVQQHWITLEELDRRIDDFNYHYVDVRNKPSQLNHDVLKPSSKRKIKQSGKKKTLYQKTL